MLMRVHNCELGEPLAMNLASLCFTSSSIRIRTSSIRVGGIWGRTFPRIISHAIDFAVVWLIGFSLETTTSARPTSPGSTIATSTRLNLFQRARFGEPVTCGF
jgi:hypothetical protein